MIGLGMEFRHLRCFLALAEDLHYGRAAQRLAMSQPPLSVAIQQLEASVGARLFLRNSKSVQLTAAGQALLPEAQALLAQARQAMQLAKDVAQGQAGRLRIGFVGAMLYRGLPQMLQPFQAAHPRLRVELRELSSTEQLAELVHDRLDAGFAHTSQVPAGLSSILVASQPLVACVPHTHALALRPDPQALVDLAGFGPEPLALVSREVSPDYHDRILSLCAQAGWQPEVRHDLRHWLSVVSVVSQGMGVALVPQALQRSGLAGAVFAPLAHATPPYETRCLWREGREHPDSGNHAALSAFLAVVREQVQRGS
jgi:DNA-binding transcriptional LysR family regulator